VKLPPTPPPYSMFEHGKKIKKNKKRERKQKQKLKEFL
jgi:hypothetical protein